MKWTLYVSSENQMKQCTSTRGAKCVYNDSSHSYGAICSIYIVSNRSNCFGYWTEIPLRCPFHLQIQVWTQNTLPYPLAQCFLFTVTASRFSPDLISTQIVLCFTGIRPLAIPQSWDFMSYDYSCYYMYFLCFLLLLHKNKNDHPYSVMFASLPHYSEESLWSHSLKVYCTTL